MYAYLEGALTYKSPSLLHLSVGGVGYEVHISLQTFDKIRHLDTARLYTHLKISEDSWQLYGFAEEGERQAFRTLIGITGVGAGTARILLSSITPQELEQIVAKGDARALERVKGIGGKTAQRLILELKGKLLRSNIAGAMAAGGSSAPIEMVHNTKEDDALIALINLGIARGPAEVALRKVENADELEVGELIKQALRVL